MITIREITDKHQWEQLLTITEFYPLFQSWNWTQVQKDLGFAISHIGIFDEKDTLLGVAAITDITARRGHYLHVRHGPVLQLWNEEAFLAFLEYTRKKAKEKHASFIRISPVIPKASGWEHILHTLGFRPAPVHNLDAEICLLLDITKSDDELLANMRKSHRYLIKKAQKMSVTIRSTKDITAISQFLSLYRSLSSRKHFVPHRGIKEEFQQFVKDDQALLFFADYEGKTIAGALILFVGNMAIYHHAASNDTYRHIPASYLLQWEVIKEAQKRRLQYYNFWGIAPEGKKNHPWQGLSLFKLGFGGERKEFIHAQDLPLSLFYWKTFCIDFLTKRLKGY